MTAFLSLEELLAVAEAALGHAPEVRDWGLLESALGRPQASVFGEDAYPALHQKAAALLHSLAKNHALVDGDKRTAWWAARLFYVLNGHDLRADEDGAYDLVIAVAEARIEDVEEIAKQLSLWVTPLR